MSKSIEVFTIENLDFIEFPHSFLFFKTQGFYKVQ